MKPTYALPLAFRNALKQLPYRYLNAVCGIRQQAISVARRRGVISRESYERLTPVFSEMGLDPPPWEDLVDAARVDLRQVAGEELFQSIRALYLRGKAELALPIGERALTHRQADTWFFGGWSLLSIANRIGKPEEFVAVARKLLRKLDAKTKLPPDALRMCGCDIAKWLLENGRAVESWEFYDPLMAHFDRRMDTLSPGVGSSLLRGFGTLNLMRRRPAATDLYRRAFSLSDGNVEGRLGTLCWQAEASFSAAPWQRKVDPWGELQQQVTAILARPESPLVASQTLVSARLLLCLRPDNIERPSQMEEELAESAAWIRQYHAGSDGFIVRRTKLAEAATLSRFLETKRITEPLIRRELQPEEVVPVIALLRRIMELVTLND